MTDDLERLYMPDSSIIQYNQQKRHLSQTQKDRMSKLKGDRVFVKGNTEN